MKTAIMQPYFFPYMGYFQLINSVDSFVFYDDVNWINKGWINRNNLLINNSPHLINIPCIKASQNKLIKDVDVNWDLKFEQKLLKTIQMSYSKAPFFREIFEIVQTIFLTKEKKISNLNINSIKVVLEYLGIKKDYKTSSVDFSNSRGQSKADRLISICKENNSSTYINASGGKKLYNKEYFKERGIQLFFLESDQIYYKQNTKQFVPWLSIIDVLMFNHKEAVSNFMNKYTLG